ncbi:MAG: hypothetical protein JRG95_22935 [Deltaproteobacteria bacterium]|nr:hypothetical protein [Deltaproteobacteria bacterium]
MSRNSRKRARRSAPIELPARVDFEVPADADPNHHLWRNGRLWWIAFTVHQDHRQERIRFSLGTDDAAEARRKRDGLLALFARAEDCNISLRFTPRGQRRGARVSAPADLAAEGA